MFFGITEVEGTRKSVNLFNGSKHMIYFDLNISHNDISPNVRLFFVNQIKLSVFRKLSYKTRLVLITALKN